MVQFILMSDLDFWLSSLRHQNSFNILFQMFKICFNVIIAMDATPSKPGFASCGQGWFKTIVLGWFKQSGNFLPQTGQNLFCGMFVQNQFWGTRLSKTVQYLFWGTYLSKTF